MHASGTRDASGTRGVVTEEAEDRGSRDSGSGDVAGPATPDAALEGACARVAWPVPGAVLKEVVLTDLDPSGTLKSSHGHVLQCSQTAGGPTFHFSAGGLSSRSRLCVPAEVISIDPEGDFDGITPPADPADLGDAYAAVATAYALQRAHEFFSGTHGWTDLDDEPLTAIVNVQHHLDACEQWVGVPEGLFLPSGKLPGLGGELLHDGPHVLQNPELPWPIRAATRAVDGRSGSLGKVNNAVASTGWPRSWVVCR